MKNLNKHLFYLLLSVFFFGTIIISPAPARSADVKISWHRNCEPDIAGYRIFWGTASHNYTNSVTVYDTGKSPLVMDHVITGLQPGATFYMAIKAFDLSGNESNFSREAVISITASESISTPPANDAAPESPEEEGKTFFDDNSPETDLPSWENDNIVCTTPVDIDGDGVDEIAYLTKGDESPDDMKLFIYTVPATTGERPGLVASDYLAPKGKTIGITNVDIDGDGIDEIAYLKKRDDSSDDMDIYIYTAPTTIGEHSKLLRAFLSPSMAESH